MDEAMNTRINGYIIEKKQPNKDGLISIRRQHKFIMPYKNEKGEDEYIYWEEREPTADVIQIRVPRGGLTTELHATHKRSYPLILQPIQTQSRRLKKVSHLLLEGSITVPKGSYYVKTENAQAVFQDNQWKLHISVSYPDISLANGMEFRYFITLPIGGSIPTDEVDKLIFHGMIKDKDQFNELLLFERPIDLY